MMHLLFLKKSLRRSKSSLGFTLIEVMIAITILSTLSVLTYQSIQTALKSKEKLQSEIDQLGQVRDALRIMERDINLAFHYRDFEKELLEKSKKSSSPAGATSGTTPPIESETGNASDLIGSGQGKSNRIDPTTHFVGEEQKVSFVSSNQAITTKNSQAPDFLEVGYEIKDCKSLSQSKTSRCLWRRTNAFVDTDPTLGGDESVLLEDITEFKLRYIGKGKSDWVSNWSSKNAVESVTKDAYPDAVEISLTVEIPLANKKKRKISTQIVAQIHLPNNPVKK